MCCHLYLIESTQLPGVNLKHFENLLSCSESMLCRDALFRSDSCNTLYFGHHRHVCSDYTFWCYLVFVCDYRHPFCCFTTQPNTSLKAILSSWPFRQTSALLLGLKSLFTLCLYVIVIIFFLRLWTLSDSVVSHVAIQPRRLWLMVTNSQSCCPPQGNMEFII